MRKAFAILLCLIVLLSTACGSSNASASEKAMACANKAIETAEGYLSYEINYKEAQNIIDDLQEDMKYVQDLSRDDPTYISDFNISVTLTSLSLDLISDNYKSTNETYSDIQDDIQKLKEYIK
jgi:hypothetical protein